MVRCPRPHRLRNWCLHANDRYDSPSLPRGSHLSRLGYRNVEFLAPSAAITIWHLFGGPF